jgi:hypothetical protein
VKLFDHSKSGKPASSFQNGLRIAAIVEDCQDDNLVVVDEEKDAVGEIAKIEASNVCKTHGVAERSGQKQLIGGLDCEDKPLAQTWKPGFVPFGGLSHVGLNCW